MRLEEALLTIPFFLIGLALGRCKTRSALPFLCTAVAYVVLYFAETRHLKLVLLPFAVLYSTTLLIIPTNIFMYSIFGGATFPFDFRIFKQRQWLKIFFMLVAIFWASFPVIVVVHNITKVYQHFVYALILLFCGMFLGNVLVQKGKKLFVLDVLAIIASILANFLVIVNFSMT